MKKIVAMQNIPGAMIAARVTGNPHRNTPSPAPAWSTMSGGLNDEVTSLKEAAAVVQRIRIAAQHELELARKLRSDAQRYQLETETRARSEAQRVILKTRLTVQKEIEELIRQASEEIQKVLADIRVIRITAQEELAAQRKFTDAARLCSMSLAIKDDGRKPEIKNKKHPAATKQRK
jgi:hypothetical protein